MDAPFDVAWDDWNAVVAGQAVTWAATSVAMTGRQSIEKQVLPCPPWLGPHFGGALVSSHLWSTVSADRLHRTFFYVLWGEGGLPFLSRKG